MSNKHTTVLIGGFGSGKSEIALNLVINSAKKGKATVLVDLDIVNPYFRSSDLTDVLSALNITNHKPLFANTGVEALSLPPDIYSAFIDDSETVVFDVGGDMTGAIALGQYKQNFDKLDSLETLYVVNANRPLTATPEAILSMLDSISKTSRLSITGFINNTNLSNETQADDLVLGYKTLIDVVRASGIPVAYTTGEERILNEFIATADAQAFDPSFIGTPLPLERYMRRDWDRFIDSIG